MTGYSGPVCCFRPSNHDVDGGHKPVLRSFRPPSIRTPTPLSATRGVPLNQADSGGAWCQLIIQSCKAASSSRTISNHMHSKMGKFSVLIHYHRALFHILRMCSRSRHDGSTKLPRRRRRANADWESSGLLACWGKIVSHY